MKNRKKNEKGAFHAWLVPVWASRAASLSANVVVLMQITYYCTNVVGLAPGIVGTLLLVSKLFDGFTDLVAGFIIDKTKTKLGKARPYELCIIGVWICTVLLFSTPNFGTVGKIIYVFALYTVINSVFATFLNVSDAVYMKRAIPSPDAQMKVLSFSAPIGIVLCAGINIAMPILISTIGMQPGGWTKIALFFAVPFGILGLGRFFFLKEIDDQDDEGVQNTLHLKDVFSVLKTNKYIFIISFALLLGQVLSNSGTAVTNYYFQYIYGDLSAASLVSVITIISPFFMLLFPLLMKKFTLKKITMTAMLIGALGNVIKFVGKTSMPMLMLGNLIGGIASMPMTMMVNIFIIECIDFGEWRTGRRLESTYSTLTGFSNKVGSGIASILVGFIMQMAGFDGTLAVQSATTNMSIIGIYSILPIVLSLIMFFVMRSYDLDEKIPQIRKELAERHAQVRNV